MQNVSSTEVPQPGQLYYQTEVFSGRLTVMVHLRYWGVPWYCSAKAIEGHDNYLVCLVIHKNKKNIYYHTYVLMLPTMRTWLYALSHTFLLGKGVLDLNCTTLLLSVFCVLVYNSVMLKSLVSSDRGSVGT